MRVLHRFFLRTRAADDHDRPRARRCTRRAALSFSRRFNSSSSPRRVLNSSSPENMFGLFPGMGAYSLLSRRIGTGLAEEMILSGRMYTAEEMKDEGLVQIIVEPGEGTSADTRLHREKQSTAQRQPRDVRSWARGLSAVAHPSSTASSTIAADECLHVSRTRPQNDTSAGECAASSAAARAGGGVGKRGICFFATPPPG